jgi:phosphatidate phosphatase APP1
MQGKIKPDDAITEKQSLDLLFLSSPINPWKDLQTKFMGQNTVPLVPRLQIKYNTKISNQT